ncbi:MAG TPA: hypothetical protein VIL36_13600 [Acidimicrobiales bacterium]
MDDTDDGLAPGPLGEYTDPAGHPELPGLLGEGLAGRLERWAADARIDEVVRRRSRERWLARQAQEEATLVGVLADLAERGAAVGLQLRSGRPQRGHVRLLGADFVALVPAGEPSGRGGEVLVALGEVAAVTTRPGEPVSVGDLPSRSRLTLAEVIIGLAGDRERVLLVLAGGHDVVRGTLWSVGQDVVTVRSEDEPAAATHYVALDAIGQVSID